LIGLWVIKSFKSTSILFPLMLVVIIVVRKLLDFLFSQRELKILDDIMPEGSKKHKSDEEEELTTKDFVFDAKGVKPIPLNPSGNFSIPLANGNVMKIPVNSLNITEEVNRTGIWKTVNNMNAKEAPQTKEEEAKGNDKAARKRGSKKDAISEEESRRLSTMNEEEEDDNTGITIKVDPAL